MRDLARPPAVLSWAAAAVAVALLVTVLLAPGYRAPDGDLSAAVVLPITLALTFVVVTRLMILAPRSVGWLAISLLGWGASLALIDAPPAVAYQHFRLFSQEPMHDIALAVCAIQLLAIVVLGRENVSVIAQWCRKNFRPVMLVLAALLLVLPSAVPSADPKAWSIEMSLASLLQVLSLVTIVAAARAVPEATWAKASSFLTRVLGGEGAAGPERIDGWVLRVAVVVVIVAATLAWFSYEAHPHVPDEVVYLYQARYLAEGRLTMPLPPVPAGFNVDLMHYEATRWFSPVPPGWPMVLAIGAWAGAPWLVNPVLAGIAVVLAYLVLGRIMNLRETRLTTLLLASSPWFLLMAMNFMTHTLTLVLALAATLGVAIARKNGSWLATFLGGLAVGAVALVRPLEGLVTALLLGFWSLAARGRRIRLAPSAALVAGTLATGLMDRPYNEMLTGSARVYPIMAYVDKYYEPGSNDLGFGPNRGLGWSGLDPFPGHGARDVVANAALNSAQLNVELLGWPVGAVVLISLVFTLGGGLRRQDWWFIAVIAAVVGAHSFYWFSGGPDFGARYWYLVIVPCCALVARALGLLDERLTPASRSTVAARTVALFLMAATLVVYVPWRAIGKYHHYRGMRADVRRLAKEHEFGRSLVLVRGNRHPDYASAATYNPIDLHADAPVYGWDASPEVRKALLDAYPDRTIWIIDGPTLTGGAYRVIAGPLTPPQARATSIPPKSDGRWVHDPVNPPKRSIEP